MTSTFNERLLANRLQVVLMLQERAAGSFEAVQYYLSIGCPDQARIQQDFSALTYQQSRRAYNEYLEATR